VGRNIMSERILQNNFQIFGASIKAESKYHGLGFETWEDILTKEYPSKKPPKAFLKLQELIPVAQQALQAHDYGVISKLLHKKFLWLLIPYFITNTAFLDIETTGLSPNYDEITTIAVYDGKQFYNFVRGENLDEFSSFIERFPCITTYYGSVFDIPFLQKAFQMEFPQIQFDLCFLLRRIGLSGGLKGVEQQVGLTRKDVAQLDGFAAVVLWKKYQQSKNRAYLDTLLAYNSMDVFTLEYLLPYAYNGLIHHHNFQLEELSIVKKEDSIPWKVDPNIVKEVIRGEPKDVYHHGDFYQSRRKN
jgi:hypothetical protein